jgi:hypothetical protein
MACAVRWAGPEATGPHPHRSVVHPLRCGITTTNRTKGKNMTTTRAEQKEVLREMGIEPAPDSEASTPRRARAAPASGERVGTIDVDDVYRRFNARKSPPADDGGDE